MQKKRKRHQRARPQTHAHRMCSQLRPNEVDAKIAQVPGGMAIRIENRETAKKGWGAGAGWSSITDGHALKAH